jgi:hypothetical protein
MVTLGSQCITDVFKDFTYEEKKRYIVNSVFFTILYGFLYSVSSILNREVEEWDVTDVRDMEFPIINSL